MYGVGRFNPPTDLAGLTKSEWEQIADQARFSTVDAGIVRLYIIGSMPQVDVACELDTTERTIRRHLPDIIQRARIVAQKLNLA